MIGGAFDKTAKSRGQAACVRGTVSSGAVEKWEVAIVALSSVGRSRACASVSLFRGHSVKAMGKGRRLRKINKVYSTSSKNNYLF